MPSYMIDEVLKKLERTGLALEENINMRGCVSTQPFPKSNTIRYKMDRKGVFKQTQGSGS